MKVYLASLGSRRICPALDVGLYTSTAYLGHSYTGSQLEFFKKKLLHALFWRILTAHFCLPCGSLDRQSRDSGALDPEGFLWDRRNMTAQPARHGCPTWVDDRSYT